MDAVLVVDDGSTDDTKEVAQEAGATVVSHETNTGKGRAVKTAMQCGKILTRSCCWMVMVSITRTRSHF